MASLTLPSTPAPAQVNTQRAYRALLLVSTLLVVFVIGLGAYVRLSDAGLGCPDWPGCYGHYVGVPDEAHEQASAANAFPHAPVDTSKAWKEMIHRYAAGTLGIMVLGLTVVAWRRAGQRGRRPWAETGLLALITVQAALGMWTVTLLLKPVIVTLHLLGGMATLALLVWLSSGEFWRQSEANEPPTSSNRRFLPIVWLALGALLGQIALGGWVSSNYAALACSDFPKCQGAWLPVADFEHGFALLRPLGQTLSGEALPVTALTAIHLTHRIGALVVTLIVGALAWRLGRDTRLQALGQALAAALGLQVSLGIANVLLQLPLALAVMHTLGAALLLAVTVVCARRLTRRGNLTPKGY